MSSLVVKKLSALLSSSERHILRFFSFSTQAQQPQETNFIAQYLISSGFSREKALKVSKSNCLVGIKTLERPESVLSFLKRTGLSDTQIKTLISWSPRLLGANVKLLEPRARELAVHGFTGKTLVQVILSNPAALQSKYVLPRLQFWREFTGNNEGVFLKVIKSNQMLITCNIDKRALPNINILRERGLTHKEIIAVMIKVYRFILQNPDYVRQCLERIGKLGFTPGSGMFVKGLSVVGMIRKDTLEKKFEFFKKTCGWTEEDVHLAFKKAPNLFAFSLERLKSKMDFLIGNAGFKPESIISLPILLTLSLEKRMIPRYYVLTVLNSKGLEKNL